MGAVEGEQEGGEDDEDWDEALPGAKEEVWEEKLKAKKRDRDEFEELFDEEVNEGEVVDADQMSEDLFGPDSDEEPGIEGEEAHKAKARTNPKLPTQEEIDLHEMTHVPYRSWCIHCRKCQGRADAHFGKKAQEKQEDENRAVTTWSVDYSYFTTEGHPIPHRNQTLIEVARSRGKLCPAVVALYDRKTKTGYLHQTISKGRSDRYIVGRSVEDIDEAGYIGQRIVLKSDQENAVVALVEEIASNRRGETVPQASAQGDSQGNGEVEAWIKKGQGSMPNLQERT